MIQAFSLKYFIVFFFDIYSASVNMIILRDGKMLVLCTNTEASKHDNILEIYMFVFSHSYGGILICSHYGLQTLYSYLIKINNYPYTLWGSEPFQRQTGMLPSARMLPTFSSPLFQLAGG